MNGGRYAGLDPKTGVVWEYTEQHTNWTLFNETSHRVQQFSEDFHSQILKGDVQACSESM